VYSLCQAKINVISHTFSSAPQEIIFHWEKGSTTSLKQGIKKTHKRSEGIAYTYAHAEQGGNFSYQKGKMFLARPVVIGQRVMALN